MLRRAARESAVVRMALGFVATCLALDLLATLLIGRPTAFFTLCALVYLAIALVGFYQGAGWARDPIVPTVGRAPDPGSRSAGQVLSTTRTTRLALESALADTLMKDARQRSREGRAWVIVGSCFVFGGALFVAVVAGDLLLFAAVLLITFVPAAMIWVLAGPPTSAEAEWGDMYRSEGPVRLSWTTARGGRYWTVRAGNRTLHVWDEVGSRLANMPWGVVDYTPSERILRVRDIDGNTVYELHPSPDAAVVHYAWSVGPLMVLSWAILALVVRVAR